MFLCLAAVVQNTQAVNPPPDGCYPGLTTAEGCSALFSLATGQGNTAMGADALFSDTSGSWNTGVGAVALGFNNADFNTAVGVAAMLLNDTGRNNTALGAAALLSNHSGSENTAVGAFALNKNSSAYNNTAVGDSALTNNDDTAEGLATDNTAVGAGALLSNTDGYANTATGSQALSSNTEGTDNTANGYFALNSNHTGLYNTAMGSHALEFSTGVFNTAIGAAALSVVAGGAGNNNTAVGGEALKNLSSGYNNVAVGSGAGFNLNSSETGNIDIGKGVAGLAGENNTIRIGDNLPDTAGASFCYIGGIVNQTAPFATALYIGPTGKLGTVQSSRRFKQDIKPMDRASEALFSLTPVSFRYKKEIDPTGISQYGLVAEDVENVNPDLVVRDKEGTTSGVRYDQINAMLLNEFLKEHKAFVEEQRKVQKLEAALDAVNQRLKKQEAQIEKVSAQIEMGKSAPQIVSNNP